MRDMDKNAFKTAMDKLRTRYGAFFGGDAEWKDRLAAYFEQLRKHDLTDVTAAIGRAPSPDFYPDRFPTAGQLQRLVIAAELERKQGVNDSAKQASAADENERLREEFSLIPIGAQAQAEYVADAATLFERIAREWQCESKRLGLDPTRPSPPEIAQRRMREFWGLWKSHEPRMQATPEYMRRQPSAATATRREPGDDTEIEKQEPQQQPMAATQPGEAA